MPFEPLSRSNRFSARIPSPSPLPLLFYFFFKNSPSSSKALSGVVGAGMRGYREDEKTRCAPPASRSAGRYTRSGADPQQPPGPVHRPRSRKRRCLRQKEHGLVPAPFRQDLGPDGLPDSVHVMTILLISRNSGIDVARRGEARCPRSGANMVQSPGQVYGGVSGAFLPSDSFLFMFLVPLSFLPSSLSPSLSPPTSLSLCLASFLLFSLLSSLSPSLSPSLLPSLSLPLFCPLLAQSRYSIDIFRAPIMCQGPRKVRCSLCL